MKLLTFITTIFNTEINYVEDLFNSFEGQIENDKLEFVIVDDASTDSSSFEFLKNKYNKNENFQFIKLSENTRRSGAFKKGIEVSKSKYIMSLDSDDLVHAKSLERFLDILNYHNEDFIFNNFIYRDFSGKIWESDMYTGKHLEKIEPDGKKFKRWSTFTAYNSIVSGDLARSLDYDLTNIKAPHDDAFFSQKWISNSKSTLFLEEPFFIYNINQPWTTFSGYKSISKNKDKMEIHWNLVKEIIKLYDKNNPLTIINITSILSSHQKALAFKYKFKIPFFWLKLKFILPRSLRKHSIYKNSHFKKHRLSGFAFF